MTLIWGNNLLKTLHSVPLRKTGYVGTRCGKTWYDDSMVRHELVWQGYGKTLCVMKGLCKTRCSHTRDKSIHQILYKESKTLNRVFLILASWPSPPGSAQQGAADSRWRGGPAPGPWWAGRRTRSTRGSGSCRSPCSCRRSSPPAWTSRTGRWYLEINKPHIMSVAQHNADRNVKNTQTIHIFFQFEETLNHHEPATLNVLLNWKRI